METVDMAWYHHHDYYPTSVTHVNHTFSGINLFEGTSSSHNWQKNIFRIHKLMIYSCLELDPTEVQFSTQKKDC